MSDDLGGKSAISDKLGLVAGAPRWWHCDTHGPGKAGAWGCPECVREMRAEIKQLRGLVSEMADLADHWPGIAYTADLASRVRDALKADCQLDRP